MPGSHILPSTSAFKVNHFNCGRPFKSKDIFCARGDIQVEGVDYFENYSHFVSGTTVRLILILSLNQGWDIRQVVFPMIFFQVTMLEEV